MTLTNKFEYEKKEGGSDGGSYSFGPCCSYTEKTGMKSRVCTQSGTLRKRNGNVYMFKAVVLEKNLNCCYKMKIFLQRLL